MKRLFLLFSLILFFSSLNAQHSIDAASYNYDLQIKSFLIKPSGDELGFSAKIVIQNAGLRNAENFCFFAFIENGTDSVFHSAIDELLYSKTIESLLSKDSLLVEFSFSYEPKKTEKIIFFTDYSLDMKRENNYAVAYLSPRLNTNSITINEIMFNPLNYSAEYIEVYNNTPDSIDIINWEIKDQFLSSGKRNVIPISERCIVAPYQYFTLASDSSILKNFSYLSNLNNSIYIFNRSSLNLNNDEDEIVLVDSQGRIQDSLRYSDKWHNMPTNNNKGISLEKKVSAEVSNNSGNWNSCSDILGGTPSKKNSFIPNSKTDKEKVKVYPNPFSPDGDGYEDITTISYSSELNFSSLRIRIFDKNGRIVRTIKNYSSSQNCGEIGWNGFDDKGNRLKTGIYIVFLELLDETNGRIDNLKIPVVIAGKK